VGRGHTLGERGGEQAHTVSVAELPTHTHAANASSASSGGNDNPTGRVLGSVNNMYHSPANLTPMDPGTITNVGGSQAHLNMQPFLTLTFCIALQGIFPSQT
jgi:microcystin-dependent protein